LLWATAYRLYTRGAMHLFDILSFEPRSSEADVISVIVIVHSSTRVNSGLDLQATVCLCELVPF